MPGSRMPAYQEMSVWAIREKTRFHRQRRAIRVRKVTSNCLSKHLFIAWMTQPIDAICIRTFMQVVIFSDLESRNSEHRRAVIALHASSLLRFHVENRESLHLEALGLQGLCPDENLTFGHRKIFLFQERYDLRSPGPCRDDQSFRLVCRPIRSHGHTTAFLLP